MRLYESRLPDGSRRLIVHLDERYRIADDDTRLDDELFPYRAGDPDPEWCIDLTFGAVAELPQTGTAESADSPMREMAVEEVEAQQDAEAVALAREALAARRAARDQVAAAASDPFAGGGRRV